MRDEGRIGGLASDVAEKIELESDNLDIYRGRIRIVSDGHCGGTYVENELGQKLRTKGISWSMEAPNMAQAQVNVILGRCDVVVIDPVIRILRTEFNFDKGELEYKHSPLYRPEIFNIDAKDALSNRIRILEEENRELRRHFEGAKLRGFDKLGSHACPDRTAHGETRAPDSEATTAP